MFYIQLNFSPNQFYRINSFKIHFYQRRTKHTLRLVFTSWLNLWCRCEILRLVNCSLYYVSSCSNVFISFIWLLSYIMLLMLLLFCSLYLDSWANLAMNRSWLMNLNLNVFINFKSYTLLQRLLRCIYIISPFIS